MNSPEPRTPIAPSPETLRHCHVAVMFADLDHFTRICLDDPPDVVFGLVRDFQRVVAAAVLEFGGNVNAFQGDGVLVTFGALPARPDCATRALRCAETILEQMQALSLARRNAGGRSVSVSIGLQYGVIWTGTIDSSRSFGPTLIGDAVNVANRLEQRAHTLGAKVVAGEDFIQRARRESGLGAPELAHFVSAGSLFVHGRHTPVDVWILRKQSSEVRFELPRPLIAPAAVAAFAGGSREKAAARY
jgi:class 3 adenylate cyclase